MPLWAAVMSASLDWGVPPWEITGETDPVARTKWLFRSFTYKAERQRAEKFRQRLRESTAARR